MPHNSLIIAIIGAALFVVQEAFEIIWSPFFKLCSLIPIMIIGILSSSGGAAKITLFTPSLRCRDNRLLFLNLPVASMIISAPVSCQDIESIDASLKTGILFLATSIA